MCSSLRVTVTQMGTNIVKVRGKVEKKKGKEKEKVPACALEFLLDLLGDGHLVRLDFKLQTDIERS